MRSLLIVRFAFILPLLFCAHLNAGEPDDVAEEKINNLKEPLYNPFVERYILDEVKSLRMDLAAHKVEVARELVDRELLTADKAISYSTNTVTYFFYLIAAVSSVLVLVGWSSIRDLKEKMQRVADEEVTKLINVYEERLHTIETQLTQKTIHIEENREEIEKTQEIHALWLRASQEQSLEAKVSLYDDILRLHPYDAEALTYKADAVLDLNEPQWAINLCRQALKSDSNYAYAFYQLGCAYSKIGELDAAVKNLNRAVNRSESLRKELASDTSLEALADHPEFIKLVDGHNKSNTNKPT